MKRHIGFLAAALMLSSVPLCGCRTTPEYYNFNALISGYRFTYWGVFDGNAVVHVKSDEGAQTHTFTFEDPRVVSQDDGTTIRLAERTTTFNGSAPVDQEIEFSLVGQAFNEEHTYYFIVKIEGIYLYTNLNVHTWKDGVPFDKYIDFAE